MEADYVRQLEDACLALWQELPAPALKVLERDAPVLVDFLAHLHQTIQHEKTRGNVWGI